MPQDGEEQPEQAVPDVGGRGLGHQPEQHLAGTGAPHQSQHPGEQPGVDQAVHDARRQHTQHDQEPGRTRRLGGGGEDGGRAEGTEHQPGGCGRQRELGTVEGPLVPRGRSAGEGRERPHEARLRRSAQESCRDSHGERHVQADQRLPLNPEPGSLPVDDDGQPGEHRDQQPVGPGEGGQDKCQGSQGPGRDQEHASPERQPVHRPPKDRGGESGTGIGRTMVRGLLPAPAGTGGEEVLDSGRDLLHWTSPLGFTSRTPLIVRARSAPLRLWCTCVLLSLGHLCCRSRSRPLQLSCSSGPRPV